MSLERLLLLAKPLEDPRNPLMGPNLKGLDLFGVWHSENRVRSIIYKTFHFTSIFFVLSQILELFLLRNNLFLALNNFSLTAVSMVCFVKCFALVVNESKWYELVNGISEEEILEISKQNEKNLKLLGKYTKYARMITYSYWVLVVSINLLLLAAPLMKYWSSPSYREDIKLGFEPYPLVFSSWFPFDNSQMPGYVYACLIQILMSVQGAAVLATFDTCAVAIMIFFKGQIGLLRDKCSDIFDGDLNEGRSKFMARIIECHRHHNFLLKHYRLFNYLLSPVMFFYVLICSITICCSVVQLTLEISTYQKVWVVQYTTGQIFQLFMFCWHANEIYNESIMVDRGIFASEWWKADVYVRRQILLLAGKLDQPLTLSAGPFTTLSIATFISVMKGSYSFFTLFSQI